MSFVVYVQQGRYAAFDVQLYQSDGSTEDTPSADDLLRFKMGRRFDAAPTIDWNSVDDANNVSFTADTNNASVTFLPADTADLTPGPYEAELAVVDESDSDRIKTYETGTVQLLAMMGGETGDAA